MKNFILKLSTAGTEKAKNTKDAESASLFEEIEDTKSFVDDMGEKTNQSSRTISGVVSRVPVLKLEPITLTKILVSEL